MPKQSGFDKLASYFSEAVDGLKSDTAVLKEILQRVETKVTLTNGRVKTLEVWKAWSYGFAACMMIFVVPFMIYMIQLHIG